MLILAQVMEEMVYLTKILKSAYRRGKELGLDFREYAFCSVLEVDDSAIKILDDTALKATTH